MMPNFKVTYKFEADEDHQFWPLGAYPDSDQALDHFNRVEASQQGLGCFTLEEADRPSTDYYMIESEPPYGSGAMYALYKV